MLSVYSDTFVANSQSAICICMGFLLSEIHETQLYCFLQYPKRILISLKEHKK